MTPEPAAPPPALTWAELFPPAGLVVRAGDDLELRYLTDDLMPALAQAANDGIHDPGWTPFSAAWADADPLERARSTVTWQWSQRASLSPERWALAFAVVRDGTVVGVQDLVAREFGVRREVATGSWLGQRHQGRGTGTRGSVDAARRAARRGGRRGPPRRPHGHGGGGGPPRRCPPGAPPRHSAARCP